DAAGRNVLRAVIEAAVKHLSPAEAGAVLLDWAALPEVATHAELAAWLGRLLLRLRLRTPGTAEERAATLTAVERLLPGDPLPARARLCLTPGDTGAAPGDVPLARLWRAAVNPAQGQELNDLLTQERTRPIAQALLLYRAARAGDLDTVARLLEDANAWRGF